MTKKEAIISFKTLYSEYLKESRGDVIAKREAWNNYTDSLYTEGSITLHQYETWTSIY